METNAEATRRVSSWEYLCRTVLEIIAAQSPCSEHQLVTAAARRGLGAVAIGHPGGLHTLLRQCVGELEQRGLVKVQEEQIVITEAGRHVLQPLQTTTEEMILAGIRRIITDDASSAEVFAANSIPAEDLQEEDAEETDTQMLNEIARELASEAEPKASEEAPDDSVDFFELEGPVVEGSAKRTASSYADEPELTAGIESEPTEAQSAPSLDDPTKALEQAIAALKAGDLAAFEEEVRSEYVSGVPSAKEVGSPEQSSMSSTEPLTSKSDSTAKQVVLGSIQPKPPTTRDQEAETLQFEWDGGRSGTSPPKLGWLVENIPRRMRTCVPVEAEIRVARRVTPRLTWGLVGQGEPAIHPLEVTAAMSLRLSAPKGGFTIEAQSPETQWVNRAASLSEIDFAAWRFTLTPQSRGSHILRLTFSYREVDLNGVIADSALPDRVIDIVVATNFTKAVAQAAVWTCTLLAGAALGAYFQPGVQLLASLYR